MEDHLDEELTEKQLEAVVGGASKGCGSNSSNCGSGYGAGGVGKGQDNKHDPF